MAHHFLAATEESVRTGTIDRQYPPVLTIDPGDTVSLETWSGARNALNSETTIAELKKVVQTDPGRGAHDITGPIEIRGAMPLQVLQVDVLHLTPREHALNANIPGSGLLPNDFSEAVLRHVRLDVEQMSAEVLPGLVVPIEPFLGFMGLAPREPGPHSSVPPGDHGGNIDLKDLTVGSSLYLPIWAEGALFYAGDGHALQGNGEMNVSALEITFSEARLRFSLPDLPSLTHPRAETADSWIALGFGATLDAAARAAARNMIVLLQERLEISALDAYAFSSLCVDLEITQAVNGTVGVHARVKKALLR